MYLPKPSLRGALNAGNIYQPWKIVQQAKHDWDWMTTPYRPRKEPQADKTLLTKSPSGALKTILGG